MIDVPTAKFVSLVRQNLINCKEKLRAAGCAGPMAERNAREAQRLARCILPFVSQLRCHGL